MKEENFEKVGKLLSLKDDLERALSDCYEIKGIRYFGKNFRMGGDVLEWDSLQPTLKSIVKDKLEQVNAELKSIN